MRESLDPQEFPSLKINVMKKNRKRICQKL